jgi:hypothetical protein
MKEKYLSTALSMNISEDHVAFFFRLKSKPSQKQYEANSRQSMLAVCFIMGLPYQSVTHS